MSILSLHNVSMKLTNNQLLDDVSWSIEKQDRIALVGRNGAGKSSLLKLLIGELTPDTGQMNQQSNLKIASLTQDVPVSNDDDYVYEYLLKNLGEIGECITMYQAYTEKEDHEKQALYQQKMDDLHAWEVLAKIDMMAQKLGLDTQVKLSSLSGGMKRRAILASALIADPDLLLLDEPTNHLDVNTIEWLESYLKSFHGSILMVTHDREFLKNVASKILEIDRGKLYPYDCDYERFLDLREARKLSDKRQDNLFDKKLAQEEVWIRQGIKARRTRNEGRVRALKAMRKDYQDRRSEQGVVKSIQVDSSRSGQMVIEAENLNFSHSRQSIIKDFSILLMRGAKLGIIGPNGCGKTTLIRLLLKELSPDSGKIKQGTSLNIAYFDQLRRQLDENKTVMDNVADGADFVTINGANKHVASYLKDFQFNPDRFYQKVSTLSGGEKNRLLLAKILAQPINFLVMDEPTNDLDIETLEILEELLLDFKGTLLLISHDRALINNVVTSVLIYEQDGHFNEYVGGYEDYLIQKKQKKEIKAKSGEKKPVKTKKPSYKQQRELEQLPKQIEALEDEISKLSEQMTAPEFYQKDKDDIAQFHQLLKDKESELSHLYKRWEELES